MTTPEALLELQNVSKHFDGFVAVDNVSFDLPSGVISGLIGPNGAGKTTLFNTLSGLLNADAGTVFLDGTAIHRLPPHRVFAKGLARTFQIPRPFPQMTVPRECDDRTRGPKRRKILEQLVATVRCRQTRT